MTTIENGTSGADNLNEVLWVTNLVQQELKKLQQNLGDNFYEKNGNTVTYKMDVVKNYLKHIQDIKWNQYIKTPTSSVWVMAIQIALESLWYDVGKIDGLFWPKMQQAVVNFQTKNELKPDGAPGTDTIKEIIRQLEFWWGWNSNTNTNTNTNRPPNSPETPVNTIELMTVSDLKKLDITKLWKFDGFEFEFRRDTEKSDNKWYYIEVVVNGKKKRIYELGNNQEGIYYERYDTASGNYAIVFWEYKNWLKNWRWKVAYSDWEKYAWEWKNDKREWKWTYTWPDWTKYDWEWKNDKREWKWTTIFPNWEKYAWEWKNDKREWKWTYTWLNWEKYAWEWKNHGIEWKWILYYRNGNKHLSGVWKDDNLWTWYVYDKDWKTRLERWVNGKKEN